MRRVRLLLLALAVALIAPASAPAITLESVGNFSSPVFVTSDPADEERLFVVEQGGTIKLRQGGVTSTFLDLTAPNPDLLLSGGEQGLLSMAFAPDYETSGHFYVYYTRDGATSAEDGDIQIDEFTASGNSASLATRRPVLTVEHSSQTNHNGGQLQFGPDDYLYIGTGDGGGGGDPDENAQDVTTLLGKLLRIDPAEDGDDPYSVPGDNPFVGPAGADEVWAYGLRNPWRFSFDRLTGNLLIGDVGQNAWEEIDYAPAPNAGKGLNFGWDCREGRHDYSDPTPGFVCPAPTAFTEPILEYPNPGPAAVVGGYVVRDASLGDLYGRYLYGDTYSGAVRSLVPALPNATGDRAETTVSFPTSFGEDACGRVYIAAAAGVSRLIGDEPADCGTPPPPQRTLTVTVGGAGSGTVGSSPSGISCPGDCFQSFAEGAEVTLTPAPGADSTFAGWGGDCSGIGSCQLNMSADRNVTGAFDAAPPEPPPTCAGVQATIVAEAGEAEGTPGLDVIVGTSGKDRIDSGGGDDLVCAGAGRDRVRAGGGEDIVKGNKAADRLRGAAGADVLHGGAGHDRCTGGPGKDRERSC